MDKSRILLILGIGFMLFFVFLIGIVLIFIASGSPGGGGIPNPFQEGKEYICDVKLVKPTIGDTYIQNTDCVWGNTCNVPILSFYEDRPLSFWAESAKGYVEMYVDDKLRDRKFYEIRYSIVPPEDGLTTETLSACVPYGTHKIKLVVRDDNGNLIQSPSIWEVTTPQ